MKFKSFYKPIIYFSKLRCDQWVKSIVNIVQYYDFLGRGLPANKIGFNNDIKYPKSTFSYPVSPSCPFSFIDFLHFLIFFCLSQSFFFTYFSLVFVLILFLIPEFPLGLCTCKISSLLHQSNLLPLICILIQFFPLSLFLICSS